MTNAHATAGGHPAGQGLSLEQQADRREKSRNLRPLLKLLPFVLRYRSRVVAAFIALLLASAATLAVPLAVRRMIDHGFSADNARFIDQYFAMLLLVALLLALASAARFYFVTWLGERVVADLRSTVFKHVTELSLSFYEVTRTGEVLSRLTADTTQIKSAFGVSASIALRNLVLFIGAVAMMVVTSIKLSSLVLLALPIIVLPLVLFGRWVRRLSRMAQDTLADTSAQANESLNAIQTVQAFGHEPFEQRQFQAATELSFSAARMRTKARAVLTACIIFITFASIVAVLWYGARDVLGGHLTGGELSQFVLYAAFAAGAMGELSQVWGEVQLAAGAAERLAELLEIEPDIQTPTNPVALASPPKGEIEFHKVRFSYPTRPDQRALNEVSFRISQGETVAIVGPSGAGKTTIFSLLLRFYDPQHGEVRIDGTNIAAADPHEVRGRMALVPQDTVVFSSSAADNVLYGKPDATRQELEAAAKAALADEFITAMPEQYDTKLGERGVVLSGGQRQRIAIARAILRDAPILLLDEATSSLDAESEQKVQQALERLMRGRTTLVIAHRLATVKTADRILVLDKGEIVAEGRHDELIKQGGLYARLARLQFDDQSQPFEVADADDRTKAV